MAAQVPGAHSWASQVSPENFRLSELDLHVLAGHPQILAALGRARRGGLSVEESTLLVGLPAALGALVLTPPWLRQDPGRPWLEPFDLGDGAPAVAGWCFAISLLGLAWLTVGWFRRDRTRSDLEVLTAVVTAAAGAIALVLMGSGSSADPLAMAPASVPVWVATVGAAAVIAAFVGGSSGRRTGDARDFRIIGDADLAHADQLIAGLPARRRNGLASDRERALQRLHERGLVADADVRRTAELPLGHSVVLDA